MNKDAILPAADITCNSALMQSTSGCTI